MTNIGKPRKWRRYEPLPEKQPVKEPNIEPIVEPAKETPTKKEPVRQLGG